MAIFVSFLTALLTTLLTFFIKSLVDRKAENHRHKLKHSDESIKGLIVAISSIQKAKDSLIQITEAFEDAISKESVLKELDEANTCLTKSYQEYAGLLSKEESMPFHTVKNIFMRLQPKIQIMFHDIELPSKLSKANKKIIQEFHVKLSDYQNQLINYKDKRIYL